MKSLVTLLILLVPLTCMTATAQRPGRSGQRPSPQRARTLAQRESWQVLGIRDKERALVYEIFYRPGLVKYRESSTATSEVWNYSTDFPSIQDGPVLGYWNSPERRGERVFGAHSETAAFASTNVVALGDTATWVFRPDASGSPSAVILGLRAARAPAGGSSAPAPVAATLTVPPRSVARAAVLFRRSINPIRINFGQTTVEGDDEKGGFLTVARNETNAPMTISVTGRMDITTHGVPTDRRMVLRGQSAGNDVTLISGRFPGEPDSFTAAVIASPLP